MEGMRNTKRAAVRKGPAAALEVLYRAEYNGMVRLAYTLVGNNAEAEEIIQDSFVEISHQLDEVHQPGAYLRTVVLRYYCGCRASEIAEIIDQPAATVRSHLRRALRSMREEIRS